MRDRVVAASLCFAEARGWPAEDYRLFFRENPDWDRLHIVLVARAFEAGDRYDHYQQVWEHLRSSLADDPELLQTINLVVMGPTQAFGRGFFSIGPEYSEVPLSPTGA